MGNITVLRKGQVDLISDGNKGKDLCYICAVLCPWRVGPLCQIPCFKSRHIISRDSWTTERVPIVSSISHNFMSINSYTLSSNTSIYIQVCIIYCVQCSINCFYCSD